MFRCLLLLLLMFPITLSGKTSVIYRGNIHRPIVLPVNEDSRILTGKLSFRTPLSGKGGILEISVGGYSADLSFEAGHDGFNDEIFLLLRISDSSDSIIEQRRFAPSRECRIICGDMSLSFTHERNGETSFTLFPIPFHIKLNRPDQTSEVSITPAKGETISAEIFEYVFPHPVEINDLKSDSDFPEGRFIYLDRENDLKKAVPGGKYTLLITGGTIYYESGAHVKSGIWEKGMKKGDLEKTSFKNHYNLKWIASDGMELDDELSADFDPVTGILTLNFPLYKSVMRFSRENP